MRARFALSFVFASSLFAAACGATNGTGSAAGGEGGSSTTNSTGAAGGASNGGGGTGGASSGGSSSGGASSGGASSGGTSSGGASSGGGGTGGGECMGGTADCNLDPADGCETVLQSDVNNCGACGVVCEGGGGVPPTCAVGQCKLDCPLGVGDCNMNPNDGCETNIQDDSQNCGGCALACTSSPCIAGACACAAETTQANLVQVDLFFMFDKSGSMTEAVQGGGTRWDAVSGALKTFFQDPANAGIGAGIQYFPITSGGGCNPICMTNADCGAFGPCLFFICAGCSGGGDSCAPADYAMPAVPIAPLGPAHAMTLAASINAQTPSGNTPTGPALQGALSHAQLWAINHPSHNVVVVLATDGDPTECTPSDIPSIANIAASVLNGSPPVKTFVIGVGASLSNLNAIAAAGGTGSAFIVDGNANVAQEFKAALDNIQNTALGCEYTIPQPAMGMLDYDKVNVQYTPGGGGAPQVILNVPDAFSCDPVTGGWYYDNPMNPTKIILCSNTCGPIELDPSGKIDILLGCATEHV